MGEVRVAVQLTNTGDLTLVRRNLMRPEAVRSVAAKALIDIGAVTCVLPSLVVEHVGLARPSTQGAESAEGRLEAVDVTEPVLVELRGRHTVEEARVLGHEVIIGQTMLEKTDLSVDCRERRLLPHPAHPDQPV